MPSAADADLSKPVSGRTSGIFNMYAMGTGSILVNLSVENVFEYGTLYHLTALALRSRGQLEICNEDIAIYAFPQGGIPEFMEKITFAIQVSKTLVSPRDKGVSKVNIRFKPR